MRVLHTVSGLWKSTGGPAEVIPSLCQNLAVRGDVVSIATLAGDTADAVETCERAGVVVRKFPITLKTRPWYSHSLRKGLQELVRDVDIVHGNGMWEYMNWRTGSEAARRKKPYVVSFHGSIMHPQVNWHLRHRITWCLMDGRYVKQAACLHACTDQELDCIRAVGLRNPVAVIPNGVEIWPAIESNRIRTLMPELVGKKTVLFMSRIHPSKGVYDLVEAWSSLEHVPNDWHLIIAGPGQADHVRRLSSLIASNGEAAGIAYVGPLHGSKRIAAFQGCDVFVCPSHTENFGVVVAEALACGKPVIATHRVPWPDLRDHRCGWWVPNTPMDLKEALLDAIQSSDRERRDMGQRGRKVIETKLLWPSVAEQMAETYAWVLGAGQPPAWLDVA